MDRSPRRRETGFTVAEMLVTLAIFTVILVATLELFDASARMSRAQTHVSELQQNQRIGQGALVSFARMAGRGGLAFEDSLVVANNVTSGTQILGTAGPVVRESTDVLTIRGAITGGTYFFAPGVDLALTAGSPVTGSVRISDPAPLIDNVTQYLDELYDNTAVGEAIILAALGSTSYGIVEVTGVADNRPDSVTFSFETTTELDALNPGGAFPAALLQDRASMMSVLQEYRFFVEDQESGADSRPILKRIRVFPGTDTLHTDEAAYPDGLVIADNVVDFQIAIGTDTSGDGLVTENDPPDDSDEWIYNATGDVLTPADAAAVQVVRMSTLVRSDRPEPNYVSPAITRIEDRSYTEGGTPSTETERIERLFRRQTLTSFADLRNI